jgi:hypothetical protein
MTNELMACLVISWLAGVFGPVQIPSDAQQGSTEHLSQLSDAVVYARSHPKIRYLVAGAKLNPLCTFRLRGIGA